MANNRLDIIIFGATGFTGKHAVKNAIHICKEQKLKFGIAGRRKEALNAVVKEFASDIEDIPIILADIQDEESLKKMTQQARVLISCCGPYIFYGEPVIKACIATRTHYVDVTVEEQFMVKMQLEYNEAAKEAGIYVVSSCAFDCVPSDLGIIFTQQKFEGEVNAVEVYTKLWPITLGRKGPYATYGTLESLTYSAAHANELPELCKKLYPTELPKFTPKLKSRRIMHRSAISNEWSTPLPTSADRSLNLRTQRFLYDTYKERPAQIEFYVTLESFLACLLVFIGNIILTFVSRVACCRYLLLRYPSVFTLGLISHQHPSPEVLNSMKFSMTFKASGWTERLAKPTDKHTNPPNKEVITRVTGDSPGYEMTSIIAILSAITILNENNKIPDNGGVLTPGAAFGKTSLIEQMNKYDIKFEVIEVISSTENYPDNQIC